MSTVLALLGRCFPARARWKRSENGNDFVAAAYTSFEEWNPDPEISNAAQALYLHIDNLELYVRRLSLEVGTGLEGLVFPWYRFLQVGMQAEETKEPGPGCGLCPGYTVSRAILADAIALTRGDRFFTTDFTRQYSNTLSSQIKSRSRMPDSPLLYSLFYPHTPRNLSIQPHRMGHPRLRSRQQERQRRLRWRARQAPSQEPTLQLHVQQRLRTLLFLHPQDDVGVSPDPGPDESIRL